MSKVGLLVGALGAICGAADVAQAQPSAVGAWSPIVDWGMTATHAHLRPDGKVLWWPEFHDGDNPTLWDPLTETNTPLPKAGYNVFCSGHAWTADGRLFVAGGHIDNEIGLDYASIYNPADNTWARLANMNAGRWYPSVTTLPNGDMLVIAGTIHPLVGENPLPQVWEMAQGRWRDLTNAQLSMSFYPFTFVAPNGRVFIAGPDPITRYLDTSGTGAWSPVGMTQYGRTRRYGSAVMYGEGKVLIAGGGPQHELPTESAEVIDLNAAAPAWRSVAPMHRARRQLILTLLPDGKVLVNGGHGGAENEDPTAPVLETELWDPVTEQFSLLEPASAYRGYHSTAVLLPDGRVLFAGGNGITTAQVFSPPYLFKGPRPEISFAPVSIHYGQAFNVGTPTPAAIAKVTLIRLASVTHAFNMNQRIVEPAFAAAAEGLTVEAPSRPELAPPGHYMLFLLNADGVPSVARIIQLGGTPLPILTVRKAGTGGGTVTSSPPGINCGESCSGQSAPFPPGTSVTLTATHGSAFAFGGFSGACTSTVTSCTFTVQVDSAVTATFNALQPPPLLFSDDFNRTSGLGPSWSVAYGGFSTDGVFAVSGAPPINGNWARLSANLGTDDYSVTAQIAVPPGSLYSGISARSADTAFVDRNLYAALISTAGSVDLYRRNEWSWTRLATAAANIVPATTYELKLLATGSNPVHLEVWLNGVNLIRFDDSSLERHTSGGPAMQNYDGNVAYDSFRVDPL